MVCSRQKGPAVQKIIDQVLEKLEESPFQMTNYASKTSGAAIVRSKTSPSWIGSGRVFWQSLPLVAYMRPPEVILEPDNHPGNCWPFQEVKGTSSSSCLWPSSPRQLQ
ncbi:SUN domain-containing protein 3-like isoform X2 [Gallus gallus]|uniref:SUN domain-containing protein 3-like isoform X2 n=1 Tax=Gallus gallus TaxID=9031 RepID=UPI001AE68B10|nr:SUN domain-containing protein 3-like isoform X2 [Gallus gallus]